MKIRKLILIFSGVFLCYSLGYAASPSEVREPAVAGAFYPKDPKALTDMIDGFLKNAGTVSVHGHIIGIIVPHAGYVYSGQVAAHAFKLLEGKKFDTVILIGGSHRFQYDGASIWPKGAWKTPLGTVEIDEELAGLIIGENPKLQFQRESHIPEHSLEVEVPFLQRVLGDFKLVPILMGHVAEENATLLAEAIVKHRKGRRVLIVISTDMSHYHPADVAEKMDAKALEAVQEGDAGAFLEAIQAKKCELCGVAAVMTMMEIARLVGNTELEILNYHHSGDVTGDRSQVVGYFSAVYEQKNVPPEDPVEKGDDAMSSLLTKDQQKELLKIARKTIETYVKTGKVLDVKTLDPVLQEEKAAFVTLKERGRLRGCIGHTLPVEPLYLSVRNNAISAASRDPRFRPVGENELGDIDLEISVLSVPELVPSADQVEIPKHGVIIKRDGHVGVFLPKVGEETGWNKEKFLGELCSQKAGLPWDCWKDPRTEIYVFVAEDFSEKD
ncbi:MAG: AmmeMemoRadiSam system protein B [Candidatus Omnitrophica bacterium]|nr:AmmeMemoRadiSam system protein B [Candidatus Omnitrophota bacterium]